MITKQEQKKISVVSGLIAMTIVAGFTNAGLEIDLIRIANVVSGGMMEFFKEDFDIENFLWGKGADMNKLKQAMGIERISQLWGQVEEE